VGFTTKGEYFVFSQTLISACRSEFGYLVSERTKVEGKRRPLRPTPHLDPCKATLRGAECESHPITNAREAGVDKVDMQPVNHRNYSNEADGTKGRKNDVLPIPRHEKDEHG
jgi:hypothetical protein